MVDAAYGPMADVVKRGRTPSFLFLSYVPDLWRVRDLFLVPGHFFSASAIERRRELGPSARGAGWVGCNILLNRLPPEARIYAVSGYEAVPPTNGQRTVAPVRLPQEGASPVEGLDSRCPHLRPRTRPGYVHAV